jgi:hypothetical protein
MSRSTARRFVGAGLLRRPGTRWQSGGTVDPVPANALLDESGAPIRDESGQILQSG